MGRTMVQIRYHIQVPLDDYRTAVAPLAPLIADTPGLIWKIWLLDDAARMGGGVYLFVDQAAAQAFLAGPLVAQVRQAAIFSDFQAVQCGVIDELSALTSGPLELGRARVTEVQAQPIYPN
jgi:hypothetical protein